MGRVSCFDHPKKTGRTPKKNMRVIGRRPKEDNFGSNRDNREKDFWEEFLSLGVTNNTQEQEGKRTFSFSQLQVVKRGV